MERDRKGLAEKSTNPVDKELPVVFPKTEEVSPVVESAANDIEAEEKTTVASDNRVGGKGRAVGSRYCRNKDDVELLAGKRKGFRRDGPIVSNDPTGVEPDIVIADDVFEGKRTAKDKDDIGHDTEAPIFAWSRSL